MNKTVYILFICVCTILYSCKKSGSSYKDCKSFSFSDIPAPANITGEMIEVEDLLRPTRIYMQDSLLFTLENNSGFFVTAYRLPGMQKTGSFIEFGSGPEEALDLKSLQFEDSLVWGFDKQRNKLFQYTYSQFLQEGKIVPQKIVTLAEKMSNRVLVINDKIFTNSFERLDHRFSVFDMQGVFQKNAGELPDMGIEQTPLEKLESYFSNMVLNPQSNLIFVAYMQTDLIEIYDESGNLITRQQGPDHFFPARKEVNEGTVTRVASKIGETRDAYFNPVAFDDEVWVLYSGKLFDPDIPNNELVNRIIVFDWNGKPVKSYVTDIGIFAFAVDRNHHTIYGITINPEFSIVKFKY